MGGVFRMYNGVSGAELELRNLTVMDNFAGEEGGVFSCYWGTVRIVGGVWSGNSGLLGGALYLESSAAAFSISGAAVFANNSAEQGGAIYANGGGDLVVAASRFVGNRATAGEGGAIYADRGAFDVSHTRFEQNQASSHGGAVSLETSVSQFVAGTVYPVWTATLAACAFVGNVARDTGGAFYATDGIAVTLRDSVFQDNEARFDGGGGRGDGATTLENVTFADNKASGVAGGAGTRNRSEIFYARCSESVCVCVDEGARGSRGYIPYIERRAGQKAYDIRKHVPSPVSRGHNNNNRSGARGSTSAGRSR